MNEYVAYEYGFTYILLHKVGVNDVNFFINTEHKKIYVCTVRYNDVDLIGCRAINHYNDISEVLVDYPELINL